MCVRRLGCSGLLGLALLSGCARFEPRPLDPAQTAASLEARSLNDPELRRFLAQNLGRELTPWPPVSWDLPQLTLVALFYHPSLDVARAQWAVARAGVKTAGARPNPTLSVSPQYAFNPEQGLAPWVAAIDFDVPVETAGKRRHRLARARQLSEAARLSLAGQAWQVRAALRAALLDHAAAQARAGLLQAVAEAQEEIVRLLEQRRAAGAVTASEVAPARLAVLKTQAELAEAKRQSADSRARVAEALGVPLSALAGVELSFPLQEDIAPADASGTGAEDGAPPAPSGGGTASAPSGMGAGSGAEAPDRATVCRLALHQRADVLAALAEYAAAEAALRLEVARQYPDVQLGTGYEYDQGQHKWALLGLGVELPVFHRNQGPIAEAQARRAEAAARLLALQARVLAEIDRALASRAAAQEQLRRLDDLLQAQRTQTARLQALQQAGAADTLDLRQADLELRSAELARLEAQLKVHQALGQLEDAVQAPFEGWSAVMQAPPRPGPNASQPHAP